MPTPRRTITPPWWQAYLDSYDQAKSNPYEQTTAPNSSTNAPRAVNPGNPNQVSGGDMADIFATAVGQIGQADEARNRLKTNVLLGRHLGVGGGEMSPGNATGDPRDAFNNPAYFAGNPVDRAAQAIQEQPLWSNDASGRLIHGSNYPGANGPTTPNAATDRVSSDLPPMGTQEQANTVTRYTPPDISFADRGLNLTPFGAQPPNPFVKRFIPPPPPPPPPPSNS